jgi:XTP/dITP diphosphohydrolase
MRRLTIPTGNAHKAGEFAELFAETDLLVESAGVCGGMPPVVEDGTSFEANAELKARALQVIAPPDAWILADDSGLEVDALGGAPGIHSARYAGVAAGDAGNLAKLLGALEGTVVGQRTARFRCVLCLLRGWGGAAEFFHGTCEGTIGHEPVGDFGFGYDPVFIPEGYGQTFAELGESVKHQLSHRGRAARELVRCVRG